MPIPNKLFSKLPKPFSEEPMSLLRKGIYDDPNIEVFINKDRTFAFLEPFPKIDYLNYTPRVKQLDLDSYKSNLNIYKLRFEKIKNLFDDASSIIEIGAGDGSFLNYISEKCNINEYACLEIDKSTKSIRDKNKNLRQYVSFDQIDNKSFDIVCLFHVLEHIVDPVEFLSKCRKLLKNNGKLIIEVPSLNDPLLDLYKISEYEKFFFQKQHPYTYNGKSLSKLLEVADFIVKNLIPHQRYDLENHLKWLSDGLPGGDAAYSEIFQSLNNTYRTCLEKNGYSDAVIAVAVEAEIRD